MELTQHPSSYNSPCRTSLQNCSVDWKVSGESPILRRNYLTHKGHQLWSQGNMHLPHKKKNGISKITSEYALDLLLLRHITKFVNFVPVVWSFHSFHIYVHSRELRCIFACFLNGILTVGTGQDVAPLVSSRNFHAGWGVLNTILSRSSKLLPPTARKTRHWLSLIHQHRKSVTVKLHPASSLAGTWLWSPTCYYYT